MNSWFISRQSPSTDTHVKSQASFLSLYKVISQKIKKKCIWKQIKLYQLPLPHW